LVSGTQGINLSGIPVDAGLAKLSDLDAIVDDPALLIFYDAVDAKFATYSDQAPETDIAITGDLGLIVVIGDKDQSLNLVGQPWSNPPAGEAPPTAVLSPLDALATPALVVDGTLIHEVTGSILNGLSVTVRNLSTGVSLTDTTGSIAGYGSFSVAFVGLDNYAAKVGDVIELNVAAQSFRVEPIQYTLTETDIELSRVTLGELIARVIPSRSELLSNFPNPFNPETWIPFNLAETADAVVTIYDVYGHLVRTIDLGSLHAGLYSTKAKAAYWNGTNAFGERVASGIYFYHLQAGEFSATRRMVILK
jgi:hypothetical protein